MFSFSVAFIFLSCNTNQPNPKFGSPPHAQQEECADDQVVISVSQSIRAPLANSFETLPRMYRPTTRRDMGRWKADADEAYRFAVRRSSSSGAANHDGCWSEG